MKNKKVGDFIHMSTAYVFTLLFGLLRINVQ